MKIWSTFLIRETQIKTTMRYYLTPVSMAIIKKSTNNKCCQGCEENRTVGGNVNWCSHCRKQYGVFLKLKIELLYDPAIPLLGIYLKKRDNLLCLIGYVDNCPLGIGKVKEINFQMLAGDWRIGVIPFPILDNSLATFLKVNIDSKML